MSNQFQRISRAAALGNANPAAGGAPIAQMPEQFIEDWWIENITVSGLAAGGVANASILVQADSAFKLIKLGLMTDLALAAVTESARPVPLVTLQITDTGSGRNLFGAPVALGALFGNGPWPHILPVPRLFLPRSNIQLAFANYSAATTYNMRFAFEGTKVFKLGGNW
ncbi:MAG: hypothetical protein ACREUY_01180 [Burkholderiales bacterium]